MNYKIFLIGIGLFSFIFGELTLQAAAVPIQKKEEPPISQDFNLLKGQPDHILANIASNLSDVELVHFLNVDKHFEKIAQAEFETRPTWLWKNGDIIATPPFRAYPGPVDAVFVTKDEKIVSVGRDDRHIYVWQRDGMTYNKIMTIDDDVNNIMIAKFSSTSNRLVLYHLDRTINVWDIQTGKKINQFMSGFDKLPSDITLSPDGTTIASAPNNTTGLIHLWDVKTGEPKTIDTHFNSELHGLTFSPDGKKLAFVGSFKGPIGIWNFETNTQETMDKVKLVQYLLFVSNTKLITYAENKDRTSTAIWDVRTGEKIAFIDYGEGLQLWVPRVSHDFTILTAHSDTGQIFLFSIESGRQLNKLQSDRALVAAFSPDDKMLVAGGANGTIFVWQAKVPKAKKQTSKQ